MSATRAIAAAAARLLGNPSLGAHMGAEGAARVRQGYTWPQVARATLDVYARAQQIATERGANRGSRSRAMGPQCCHADRRGRAGWARPATRAGAR